MGASPTESPVAARRRALAAGLAGLLLLAAFLGSRALGELLAGALRARGGGPGTASAVGALLELAAVAGAGALALAVAGLAPSRTWASRRRVPWAGCWRDWAPAWRSRRQRSRSRTRRRWRPSDRPGSPPAGWSPPRCSSG